MNFDRWARLNPSYRLKVLDRAAVKALLEGEDLPIGDQPAHVVADIARARLLLHDGGIWVDASLFPVKPLDE